MNIAACGIYRKRVSGPFTDICQLSNRRGDDAVQHYGQQLLAAGGRHLSSQPSGHHCVYREKLL